MIAVSWLLPGHYLPWAAFQQQAAALAALMILALPIARKELATGSLFRLDWKMLLFALLPMAQWLIGQTQFLMDAVVPASLMLVVILGANVGRYLSAHEPRRVLVPLYTSLIVASIISVLLQVFQWQGITWLGEFLVEIDLPYRPFANIAQPNHLATLLCIALTGVWYMHSRRIASDFLFVCLTGCLLFGLVMTQSRSGLLTLVLLTICRAVIWRREGSPSKFFGLLVFTPVLTLMGMLAWVPINRMLLLLPEEAGIAARLHAGSRLEYWPALLRASFEKPWFGWGWNNVAAAQQWVGMQRPAGYEQLASAHNIVLDLALQTGWPITLLATFCGLRWYVGRMRSAGSDLLVPLLSIAVIFLHAMTEYPLEYAYFLVPLGLFVGVVDNRFEINEEEKSGIACSKSRDIGWRWVRVAVLAVFCGLLLWIGVDYVEVEESDRQARLYQAGIGVPIGAELAAPSVKILDALREYHRFRFTLARIGMSEEQLAWMGAVARR